MDRRLRSRVCNVSTREDPHTSNLNSIVQDPYHPWNPTVRNRHNGPRHWLTTKWYPRLNPHHRGPWLHSCRPVPPMLLYDYRPKSSPTLPRQRLQVVWLTEQDDLRQRSSLHVPLCKSTGCQTRSISELIDGLPSSDRWTLGTQKPVDRTISSFTCSGATRRLVPMAFNRH